MFKPVSFCALLAMTAFYAHAQVFPSVIDFRIDPEPAGVTTWSEDQSALLIDVLFPNGTDGCPEEIISDVRSISGVSLSQSGAREGLITFISAPCGTHAAFHGNAVLLRDNQIIAHRSDLPTEAIALVQDLDGDQLNEVITTYTDGGQGSFSSYATTLTFKDGQIQVSQHRLAVKGLVSQMNCASSNSESSDYAAAFFVVNGELKQQNYSRSCAEDSGGDYIRQSSGPLQLEGYESDPFPQQ